MRNFLSPILVSGILFVFTCLHAEPPARLILNGAHINIVQGAKLVVQNSSTNAITRISGNIISEGEFNVIKWNIGTATGDYEIPLGNNTAYYPLFFTPSAAVGDGYFNFSTYPTPWNNSSQLPTGITQINNAAGADNSAFVIDRFWRIDAQGYSTKPALSNLLFTYLDAEHSASGNTITESNLRAQRYNDIAMTWGDYPPTGAINTTVNTVTVASLATSDLFKWWTLVDKSSPLPVTLTSFTAVPEVECVRLDWTTETEVNNDYFTVEKSENGSRFEFVTEIDGAGTSNTEHKYTTLDCNPLPGVSYYRLMQTDFDGKNSFSNLVSVKIGQSADTHFNIYPNPTDGRDITLKFSNITTGNIKVKVYSHTGKEMYHLLIPATNAIDLTTTIDLPVELPVGFYFIKIDTDKITFTKKLILSKYQ